MMILGGVPIRVMVPPKIEAKASGIRMNPGVRLALAADFSATGINRASAPTLLIKAESKAEILPMKPM